MQKATGPTVRGQKRRSEKSKNEAKQVWKPQRSRGVDKLMLLTGLPLELKQVNIIITCLMIELVENNQELTG